jgi:hypothetical protein
MRNRLSMLSALMIVTLFVMPIAIVLATLIGVIHRDTLYLRRTVAGCRELAHDWKRVWRSEC